MAEKEGGAESMARKCQASGTDKWPMKDKAGAVENVGEAGPQESTREAVEPRCIHWE